MITYRYLVFPASVVLGFFQPSVSDKPDAYLSKEPITDALKVALKFGYRWVRTDGETAIFELQEGKETPQPRRCAAP